jgi:glutamate N-acetyltransferase/amino-acid N-acetyltransferase
VKKVAAPDNWFAMAEAIMTTDTYPKLATRGFEVGGERYTINGIAKGAGMIAPDMATMLSFVVTDFPLGADALQKSLNRTIGDTFNSISVDSDTSTSDTVLLLSALDGRKPIDSASAISRFRQSLKEILQELALSVVRDGEGATKQVAIMVRGAKSRRSARAIAFSIANSPLVKTAVAGEDANWGRIVMAVGKAGEPADRDRLKILFGDICVAEKGERSPDYDESAATRVMQQESIEITVDVGIGKGAATVWTCDLTADYIAINADYRS